MIQLLTRDPKRTHKRVRGRHGTPVATMAVLGAGPIIFAVVLSSVLLHIRSERLLEGKHLRMLPREVVPALIVKRNASGNFVDVEGLSGEVLKWLSQYLGFTYSFVEVKPEVLFGDSPTGPGWKNYLINKTADLAVGPLGLIPSRQVYLDYTYPFGISYHRLLTASPDRSLNFESPWKPFSQNVWLAFIVSLLVLTITMYYTWCFIKANRSTNPTTDYIIQVILAQGGYLPSNRLSIRIVATVWCLASFVLVNSYNSTLISFVSSPMQKSVIDKVEDMPRNTDLQIVVNKGLITDTILSSSEIGVFKYLGDMLKQKPTLRCSTTNQCTDKVLTRSFVYMAMMQGLLVIIDQDVAKTGECRFTVTRGQHLPQLFGFATPKNSPHRRLIDNQMLRLWETGLLQYWDTPTRPTTNQCLSPSRKKSKNTILGLEHLLGVFMLLLYGYVLASVACLSEFIIRRYFLC